MFTVMAIAIGLLIAIFIVQIYYSPRWLQIFTYLYIIALFAVTIGTHLNVLQPIHIVSLILCVLLNLALIEWGKHVPSFSWKYLIIALLSFGFTIYVMYLFPTLTW